MITKFRSKIDWWIILLYLLVLVTEIIVIFKGNSAFSSIIGVFIVLFLTWMIVSTYYEFMDDYLLIKCGPFKEKVLYKEIKKIDLDKSFSLSNALSSDRIEIICYNRHAGFVSPKDKKEFIKMLKSKGVKSKFF